MTVSRVPLPLLLILLSSAPGLAADLCSQTDLLGPYGFQLAGATIITGSQTPVASIGRLVFDGSGNLSGSSSVNFNGWFLGNPVTGAYVFQTDCTVTWQIQDDSGGWQHFAGKVVPGGSRVEAHQTDPDTGERGVLEKQADRCSAADFRGRYQFSISGIATPLAPAGGGPGLSVRAVVEADGAGNLAMTDGKAKTAGSYQLDSDCMVQLDMGLPDGDSSRLVKLRGVLVNGGKTVLAVGTDPGQVAVARFTAVTAEAPK